MKKTTKQTFRKGNLVIDNTGKVIVLVTKASGAKVGYPVFSGVVVSINKEYPYAEFSDTWTVDAFEKYTGTVRLKNNKPLIHPNLNQIKRDYERGI